MIKPVTLLFFVFLGWMQQHEGVYGCKLDMYLAQKTELDCDDKPQTHKCTPADFRKMYEVLNEVATIYGFPLMETSGLDADFAIIDGECADSDKKPKCSNGQGHAYGHFRHDTLAGRFDAHDYLQCPAAADRRSLAQVTEEFLDAIEFPKMVDGQNQRRLFCMCSTCYPECCSIPGYCCSPCRRRLRVTTRKLLSENEIKEALVAKCKAKLDKSCIDCSMETAKVTLSDC